MTLAQLEQAKKLEDRILQLELVKKYMQRFFDCKPYSVKLDVTMYGQTNSSVFPELNGRNITENHAMNKSDSDSILFAIEERILKLQEEFKEI